MDGGASPRRARASASGTCRTIRTRGGAAAAVGIATGVRPALVLTEARYRITNGAIGTGIPGAASNDAVRTYPCLRAGALPVNARLASVSTTAASGRVAAVIRSANCSSGALARMTGVWQAWCS